MNKLIKPNSSKKLKFLKYSLLASISVGSIIAVPFESAASSEISGSLISLGGTEHYKNLENDNHIQVRKDRSKSLGRAPSKKGKADNNPTPDSSNKIVTANNVTLIAGYANDGTEKIALITQAIEGTSDKKVKASLRATKAQIVKEQQKIETLAKAEKKIIAQKTKLEKERLEIESTETINKSKKIEKNAQELRKLNERLEDCEGKAKAAQKIISNAYSANQRREEKKANENKIRQEQQQKLAEQKLAEQKLAEQKQIIVQKILDYMQMAEKSLIEMREGVSRIVEKSEKKSAKKKLSKIKKEVTKLQEIERRVAKAKSSKEIEEYNKEVEEYNTKTQNLKGKVSYPPALPVQNKNNEAGGAGSAKINEPVTPYVERNQGELTEPEDNEDGYLNPNPNPKPAPESDYLQVIAEPTTLNQEQENFDSGLDTDEAAGFGKDWDKTNHKEQENFDSGLDTDEAAGFGKDRDKTNLNTTSVLKLYNSPLAQQDRENHKKIVLELIRQGLEGAKLKKALKGSLPYLDQEQFAEVVAVAKQIQNSTALNSKVLDILKEIQKEEVKTNAAGHASMYESEQENEAQLRLQESQNKLNLINKAKGQKGLSVIHEAPSYENLALEQSKSINSELNKDSLDYPDSVHSISEFDSTENLDEAEGLNNEYVSDVNSATEAEDIQDQSELQKMIASDDQSEDVLPVRDEESSENNSLKVSSEIQEESKESFGVRPASYDDCGYSSCLALSDDSEDEETELPADDDNNSDSGIDTDIEEKIVEQISNSEESGPEVIDMVRTEERELEQVKQDILQATPTTNAQHKIVGMLRSSVFTRLDPSEAVAAGDEESPIQRGLWMRSMYGTNNQGRVNNINGYRGINKGGTVGFDVEIENNIIGIAYSNVHSVFKFKNNKNNDKEIINSHVISIYGQKELPKNFVAQALVTASKNFIKNKTTYSLGDAKFKSNVKHHNHSYNAEALINYNHLLKNNLIITPNIGLRYGKSRDGIYNETGISVQEIALTMKENNILSGIIGTKVKIPLKDVLKFNNLGLTLHGAMEHNFNEKTQRVNRVIQIQGNKFTQHYVIPKQPKTAYNLGTSIMGSVKNTTISLEYNYYLNKYYQSHQGSIKLKVNL